MIKRQIFAGFLFSPLVLILTNSLPLMLLGVCYAGWLITNEKLKPFYRKLLQDAEKMFL